MFRIPSRSRTELFPQASPCEQGTSGCGVCRSDLGVLCAVAGRTRVGKEGLGPARPSARVAPSGRSIFHLRLKLSFPSTDPFTRRLFKWNQREMRPPWPRGDICVHHLAPPRASRPLTSHALLAPPGPPEEVLRLRQLHFPTGTLGPAGPAAAEPALRFAVTDTGHRPSPRNGDPWLPVPAPPQARVLCPQAAVPPTPSPWAGRRGLQKLCIFWHRNNSAKFACSDFPLLSFLFHCEQCIY